MKDTHKAIILVALLLVLLALCIPIWKLATIAKSNPCKACLELTEYICINKSDIPQYWRPNTEWNNIHNQPSLIYIQNGTV